MPDVIGDAFLLHQAADEVEVAFAVLHAIRPRAPLAAEPGGIDPGAAVVGKHGLQDLHHVLVLEDAAIGAEREMPQPRPQLDPVEVEAADRAAQVDRGDPAVDVAKLLVGSQQLHGRLRAEQLGGDDRLEGLRAHQLDPVFGQAAELLARVHAAEQQLLVAERALEPGFGIGGHGVPRRPAVFSPYSKR